MTGAVVVDTVCATAGVAVEAVDVLVLGGPCGAEVVGWAVLADAVDADGVAVVVAPDATAEAALVVGMVTAARALAGNEANRARTARAIAASVRRSGRAFLEPNPPACSPVSTGFRRETRISLALTA